jgi:hypothetical protein
MFLRCGADCVVTNSWAKLPSPHTHPRGINKERFRLSLILQLSVNHLPELLAAVRLPMMHFLPVFNGTSFKISAG